MLPEGVITLAALHDIGKITLGFQAKCASWVNTSNLDSQVLEEAPFASSHRQLSDHALISQVFLQKLLKPRGAQLWAVAAGSHHGRVKGRNASLSNTEFQFAWAEENRKRTTEELIECFGPLPVAAPDTRYGLYHSDLWLFAGLITVADWIGSNETFFSPVKGVPLEQSRRLALAALQEIGWPGGTLRNTTFSEAFASESSSLFSANPLQAAVAEVAATSRLILIEGPMGCGKTEAALHAAQLLIASGQHHGIYFALPTQVTSNRIHQRIRRFLHNTLADSARLRLAHGNAWLEDDFDLRLHSSADDTDTDGELAGHIREGRSWFASSKQALLAPYGVGTIDQALQGIVVIKHFFVRRFALAGKVVILDEIHSYDVYTGTLVTALVRELINLGCSVIILSATLTAARRSELLAAAGVPEGNAPDHYPLVTVSDASQSVRHLCPEWNQSKTITMRAETITEHETIEALVERAESGQHVLWIRNTVIEAQEAFRNVRNSMRESAVEIGLLHSRFPFAHREKLEEYWLERLGKERPQDGPGSILIATQVVEQSVDIDLDFIVSDLAPTDMLLQRMGRLWRHERPIRATDTPEFWIRLPDWQHASTLPGLKKALGRSARVYAPYVLLRAASVVAGRSTLQLPGEIRPLLEATYAEPSANEPAIWRELHEELEKEKQTLQGNAEAVMRVFGLPMVDVEDDKALTRRKGQPTVDVVLIASLQQQAEGWVLQALDETSITVSQFEWRRNAARFLHRWMVRMPRWMVPGDAPHPRWLTEHLHARATFACVQDDGRCSFGEIPSDIFYHQHQGVFAERPPKPTPKRIDDDDDEFDY